MSTNTPSKFIIQLNRVDCLTLTGVMTSAIACALAIEHKSSLAISILFMAMLVDALDGILARKYQLERSFGRYLDGFMDVLIYLVPPSIVIYQWDLGVLSAFSCLLLIGAGCIRLSVFNDIGNIESTSGKAYLGAPVFWSIPLLGIFQITLFILPNGLVNALIAISLISFGIAMLWNRSFFKFKNIKHILAITIGGSLLFAILHIF